jgi:hypothetical protein
MFPRYRSKLALVAALVLILAAGVVAPGPLSAAREETVEARGMAPFSGRKDLAREQALSEAFRQAVRQAVGVLVESESLMRNQILVTDQVLAQSNGFIKKYSIISESQDDGTYTVDIRATVSEVKLKKALDAIGLTARKMGKPKIMLLLTENGSETPAGAPGAAAGFGGGVAETCMHDILIRKGFDLVERRALLAARKKDPASGAETSDVTPSPEALAALARSGEVQIVLSGSASSRSTSLTIAGTAMHPCQATVSAKAVNADNGEVLASWSAQAASPHISTAAGEAEALGKAAREVAEQLSQQILANWRGKAEGTRTVRLAVSGLGGYDDLRSFKAALREGVEGVEEIWERSFEAGAAKFDVELAPSSSDLVEALSALSVQGKPVRITSFTSNVVQLTVGTRKGPAQ